MLTRRISAENWIRLGGHRRRKILRQLAEFVGDQQLDKSLPNCVVCCMVLHWPLITKLDSLEILGNNLPSILFYLSALSLEGLLGVARSLEQRWRHYNYGHLKIADFMFSSSQKTNHWSDILKIYRIHSYFSPLFTNHKFYFPEALKTMYEYYAYAPCVWLWLCCQCVGQNHHPPSDQW